MAENHQRWLNPSAALNRFTPPKGVITGIKPVERRRARYGFRLGDIGLLINQDTVSEVLEKTVVCSIPRTPPWLSGLANVRGNLVPVFDLQLCLGLEYETQEKQRLLILDRGDKAVGVLIDSLPQPVDTAHKLVRLPPLPTALRPYTAGAYIQNKILWLEFDHEGFFQALGAQIATIA